MKLKQIQTLEQYLLAFSPLLRAQAERSLAPLHACAGARPRA